MKTQQTYWETKIIDWEKSIYSKKKSFAGPVLDQLASPFRKILAKRLAVTQDLLAGHIRGKVVADLGCGTGLLLQKLIRYRPKKLIGVDIASSAIRLAKLNFKNENIQSRFICADIRKEGGFLKEADIVVGVGFLDYFQSPELLKLLAALKGKKFLFSFPARVWSLREMMQKVYIKLAGCPGSYKYSRKELDALLRQAGLKNWWYYDKEKIRFVTNLPRQATQYPRIKKSVEPTNKMPPING